jgi:hypothetical protein
MRIRYMSSANEDQPTLFLAPRTADATDRPQPAFDGSEEAMRQLRHPFAAAPVDAEVLEPSPGQRG